MFAVPHPPPPPHTPAPKSSLTKEMSTPNQDTAMEITVEKHTAIEKADSGESNPQKLITHFL